MKKRLFGILILLGTALSFFPADLYPLNAVASIKSLAGDVKVNRMDRTIIGRKGLVLNDHDVVITAANARTTILFRDGSEIRLFANTRFIIEKTEEREGELRGFINRLKLQIGSLWGKFAKNRQTTTIETPTATCGIKGTSVTLAQHNAQLDVSLSTGVVELENEDEKVTLQPGKMIEGITKRGSFKENIKDIPYLIQITPEKHHIELPSGINEREISFALQIVDIRSKNNIERSVDIYLTASTDKIVFPQDIRLNRRGYERVIAKMSPFQKTDNLDGQIEVTAIAEGRHAMNIGAGRAVLTYDLPGKRPRTIRIDADTGTVQ